jgi:hypothetical protein
MRSSYWVVRIALSILGIACLSGVSCSEKDRPLTPVSRDEVSSHEKKPLATVRAVDLSDGSCRIVGRLGKQYGEISRIRGVWTYVEIAKPEGPSLRITHIDGKEFASDQQILVWHGFVIWVGDKRKEEPGPHGLPWPRDGQILEGRVYEAGGYPNEPPPAVEGILHPHQPPAQRPPSAGFAFHSFIYVID